MPNALQNPSSTHRQQPYVTIASHVRERGDSLTLTFQRSGPQSVATLLEQFKHQNMRAWGEQLCFGGVGNKDVYNITAPFDDEGESVIAGRVEARETEFSDVMFFVFRNSAWMPKTGARSFPNLQDPFVTRIFGELVFGGVEIWANPVHSEGIDYRTVFYRGESINELRLFAVGPQYMKDIRLIELADGKIGVFTRPKGPTGGGEGQIGFTTLHALDELSPATIFEAELLSDQFLPEEWGGANELHLLNNGHIGVLGHIACIDGQGDKHYYSMTFAYDPETRKASPMKIIATRAHFPASEPKRPYLADVLFSGGLIRLAHGQADLYTGVSDAEAHKITIPDPFLEYESV